MTGKSHVAAILYSNRGHLTADMDEAAAASVSVILVQTFVLHKQLFTIVPFTSLNSD